MQEFVHLVGCGPGSVRSQCLSGFDCRGSCLHRYKEPNCNADRSCRCCQVTLFLPPQYRVAGLGGSPDVYPVEAGHALLSGRAGHLSRGEAGGTVGGAI